MQSPGIDHGRMAELQAKAEREAGKISTHMSGSRGRLKPLSTVITQDRIESKLSEFEQRRKQQLAEKREQYPDVDCLHCLDQGECGMCERGEHERERRYQRQVQHWIAGIDDQIGIPRRFVDMSLETYPRKSPVVEELTAWLAEHGSDGVMLVGDFGRGKTALISSTLRAAVINRAVRDGLNERDSGVIHNQPSQYGMFTTLSGLLESLRPGGDTEWTLKRYQRVQYLVIDDIGAERLTDWGADRLFEIVNYRHNELMPTLLTSNLTLNELRERINRQVAKSIGMPKDESGDRIVNRLIESCRVIKFEDAAPNLRLRGES